MPEKKYCSLYSYLIQYFLLQLTKSDSFDTSISLCYISKSELNTSFRKEEAPASHLADALMLLAGNT
jgi:hypothetical protein